ncbi:VanW family protein [Pseudonocardia eucalypti]|uniref:VanW family protein n=1 Tax=Pseudonocardia eucalypti TaxID=648755 RepID=A0ABP9PMD5_9PSEU|nr:vancomycin resistance protein YoaR [Pseudonocardia eucalypti]
MLPVELPENWWRLDAALGRYRGALIGGVAFAFLSALYVVDLVSGYDRVPGDVVAAGVRLGGLGAAEAEQTLRAALAPRLTKPVELVAGTERGELDPLAAGLEVDWPATVARAMDQPVNPFTRIGSLFGDREVGVVSRVDDVRAGAALDQLGQRVGKPPVEGSVRFTGLTPVPVYPTGGHQLDLPGAVRAVADRWLAGAPVSLPVVDQPATASAADVDRLVAEVAGPAVSGPLTLVGDGARATLEPSEIAAALRFRVDGARGLVPDLDLDVVRRAVSGPLAATDRPGRDASIGFSAGALTVVPAQDGRVIDYPATFRDLGGVLSRTDGPRELTVVYQAQPARVTTEELRKVLDAGEMSTFTTGGFAADSGRNIRRAAEMINGKVVRPGQTFSLNGATNPRNAANGFVEAGIIEDGEPARGIGGGVSQVATTLFNAAYFAGMVDIEHKEHSYYISRYPVAREATVFNDVIDVKFRNDTPGAVVIRTIWTPSSLTVKLLGTKVYEVSSATGARRNQTSPDSHSSDSDSCKPSKGAPGFTATDTRTLRDLRSGEVRSETRTVTYRPSPTITCDGDDDDDEDDDDED